ncbi:MAG TPA: hypothetical protein VGD19_05175 [Allosphingosinicella sp.]
MKRETQYLLRRASEEARQAIASDKPEAAEVHEALSVRYSAKALMELVREDDEAPPLEDPGPPDRAA